MNAAIATAEEADLATIGDQISEAQTQATLLEGIARRFQAMKSAKDQDSDQLEAAKSLAAASLTLATSLRDWIKGIESHKHRKLTGLLVGFTDDSGRRWFIHEDWNWGNLVRCAEPECAAIWQTVPEIETWLRSLRTSRGQDAKGKPWPAPIRILAGRHLDVFRVRVIVEPESIGFQINEMPIQQEH